METPLASSAISFPSAEAGPAAGRRKVRLLRVAGSVLLAQGALGLTAGIVAYSLRYRNMADFHVMRDAAREIAEGRAGGFVYPPPAAFPLIPLAYLPYEVAAAIWLAVLVATVPLTLWALGVRDWRCYAATFLAASTLAVFGSGSLSSILALGVALLWRFRDRRGAAVVLAACVVVAKIFLWPLLLWLAATGRRTTAIRATAATAGLALGGWAVTGFAGLVHYPHRLGSVAGLEQADGYSPVALGLALGLPLRIAELAAAGLAVGLIAAMFVVARQADGERRSLALAILAALAATPISWLHYFVLLVVGIALARPRFGPLWLVPVAFWLVPMRSDGDPRLIVTAAAVCSVVGLLTVKAPAAPA